MKDNELRGVILEKFYEKRREGVFAPMSDDFNPPIPPQDLYRICEQLYQHRLIEFNAVQVRGYYISGSRGKISANGVDVVENEGINSPINISITTNTFNQSFVFDIEQILLEINKMQATNEEKTQVKEMIKSFIEHPLVTSIIGGILGNLPGLLK
jgi:hypothetical protein